MSDRSREFDFGISGLSTWFDSTWTVEYVSPTDVVRAAVVGHGGRSGAHIADDAVRLWASPLSADALGQLWQGATGCAHVLGRWSIDGRRWMRQIVDVCVGCGTADAKILSAERFPSPPGELLPQVLAELRDAQDRLWQGVTERGDEGWLPDLVGALEQCIVDVSPDVGFRLFLRALNEYWVPATTESYDRWVELGERFGYGEFVVHVVEHLTRLPER
ncbi:hypothetical protein [Streptomyces sp. NPDC046887]|uniref:hypothetical protein n=1 Tax=Streptomyces sp. NPDC046887 TaxID=3155472 RepID=UPI0033CB4423